MKYLFFLFALTLAGQNLSAQKKKYTPVDFEKEKSKDAFIIDINNNNWMNTPKEMRVKNVSVGVNLSIMQQLFDQNSNANIAIGVGINFENIKNNSILKVNNNGVSYFDKIPNEFDYQTNKLNTTFIEVPLEVRILSNTFRNNRSIKLHLGIKGGYLIHSYVKYKGDDYRIGSTGEKVKFKEYQVKNLEPFRYGLYARFGFGKFSISGYSSLTNVFKKDKGPEVTAYSIGLTIIPFK